MKKMLLIAASLLTLSTATSTAATSKINTNESIWLGGSNGSADWRAVGRDELIIWSSRNKSYLVKIWRPYRSLKFVNTIGFQTTANRLTTFDSIFIDGQRLPIKSIIALDPNIAKEMRYQEEYDE